MKGVIFTELVSMIERQLGDEVMDDVFDKCPLHSGGAYTSVGTYNHTELLKIVTTLSEDQNTPVPDLVQAFGKHLFEGFTQKTPEFFVKPNNCFEFLESIDGHIHVEVRKLYPDAELPVFDTDYPNDNTLVLTYSSKRPFSDLALGMIKACIHYYQEEIDVEFLDQNTEDTYIRVFTLTRKDND